MNIHRSTTSPLPRRTFARVWAFDIACPNCGVIDCVRTRVGRPWWKDTNHFHRWRSRWRCRACRRVFAIGLAIWPVRRAGNRPAKGCTMPSDRLPTLRELQQLRDLHALGLVQATTRGLSEPVNVACYCEAQQGDDPECPLHGRPDEPEPATEG
jgi:hypothetical protein